MGLFTKDEPGQAMFFSPGKIAAARAHQKKLDGQKEQERLAKEMKKQHKTFEKEQKAQEARERRMARQETATQKKKAKQHKKETQMLQKQANQQLIFKQTILKTPASATTKPKKRKAVEDPSSKPSSPKSRLTRSGRASTLPTRFHE